MKLFKYYLVFGISLLIIGIVFDFIFVQTRIANEFKSDPVPYLNSWSKQLYDLTKFYLIVLGVVNILLALLSRHLSHIKIVDSIVFSLIIIGSVFIIATGFWYANAGPSFKWELRCTVLTVGLIAVISGLGLEMYKFLTEKHL
jgi:hypothetical protein